MKKSAPDHTLAAVRAAVSAVPVLGGPIASLLSDYLVTSADRSRDRALSMLADRLEALGDRIDAQAVDRDEFAELFKSCYLSIVWTHREDKLRAASGLLTNLLLRRGDPDKLSYTQLDHFSRCLDTLSGGAVEVLAVAVREFGTTLPRAMGVGPARFPFCDFRDKCSDFSPDLLMGLVAELESAHLLCRTDTPAIKTDDYGNYPLEVTGLGMEFAKFLAAP